PQNGVGRLFGDVGLVVGVGEDLVERQADGGGDVGRPGDVGERLVRRRRGSGGGVGFEGEPGAGGGQEHGYGQQGRGEAVTAEATVAGWFGGGEAAGVGAWRGVGGG